MADIFISYAREDQEVAQQLAGALEAQGWSVFWDRKTPAGQTWRFYTGKSLEDARCVIVAWSAASIDSDWVHEEAEAAKTRRVLVPVLIESVEPPFGFRTIQAADLVGWDGDARADSFVNFCNDVSRLLGVPPTLIEEQESQRAEVAKRTQPPGTVFRDTLKDGSRGPEMVVIPAGAFLMGSPREDVHRYANEGPQHSVTVEKQFAMGKYTVTFSEYDQYCASIVQDQPLDSEWGRENRPVINVSWADAVAYCEWLSAQTGKRYRLPSEAEWEYAARAGTTTAYWWGDKIGTNRANCNGCGSKWDKKQTAPVGSFGANAFGLHDMLGNVDEWMQDCMHRNYIGAPADGSVWETGGDSTCRVLRGGSWRAVPNKLRSSDRNTLMFVDRIYTLGFRLARTL